MKKKVLFVLEAFDKGGIEKVTLDIVNNLDKEKYEITVKTIWFGGHCQSKVKKYIKVEPFFKKYRKGIMRLFIYLPKKLLYKLYIKDKYDIEIAAGDGIPSRIIAGSSNKNSKKVSWIHMDVLEKGSQLKELRSKGKARKFYEPFDLIACVSNECRKNFIKKFGFNYKTICVNNPIPNNHIINESNENIDIEFNSDVVNIVAVGRLAKEKGFDRLINVAKKLRDDKLKFHLYIIGDGNEKEWLKKSITENNLENYISILGFKSNPYKYMKHSDIFILPSRCEAYPTVLIEACILKVPIVATRCCGVSEIIGGNEWAYVVDNNEQSIYKGAKQMISNKNLIQYYKSEMEKNIFKFDFEYTLKNFENKIL
ncbi:glycosyltransferase [Clostridium perfringens]|uniref:glycosyltransferase n=1 Tax=Clostridium perfringens TaxID=1502 RepID=UPI002AC3C446|nr:glycosyltransferase [Clostridium perfringens]MDZ4983570.1 glycosyltransferase [Clostridium perfringens]